MVPLNMHRSQAKITKKRKSECVEGCSEPSMKKSKLTSQKSGGLLLSEPCSITEGTGKATSHRKHKKKRDGKQLVDESSKPKGALQGDQQQSPHYRHKRKDQLPKHPRIYKKNKKPNNPTKAEQEKVLRSKVVLPTKAEDISANWKRLQKVIPAKKKKKIDKHNTPQSKKQMEACVTKEDVAATSSHSDDRQVPQQLEVWFDDVDEVLLECSKPKATDSKAKAAGQWDNTNNPLVKPQAFPGLTKNVAMDCEMVGVGEDGRDSILARVSLVNQFGACVYDRYVQASEKVTDFRTRFSGIRPKDIEKAEQFLVVQKEVSDILKGRVLVGHALHNDLKVLFLSHPKKKTRDTSKYKPFRRLFQGRIPSLKKLSDQVLGVQVQQGEHNSVQDAQAAMRLYTMYRQQWEKELNLRSATRSTTTSKRAAERAAKDS